MLNPLTFDVEDRSQAPRRTGAGTNPASRKSPLRRLSAVLTRALLASVGFMSFSGIAAAQQAEEPPEEQVQSAGDQQAVDAARIEAGPIEEAEAPESAVSSPPMAMDDPATPGPQGVEVNFVGSLERAGQGRGAEGLLDANYGIGDRIQLKFERPYVSTGQAGEHQQTGPGATLIGVKWRFLDRDGWQLAFYPAYEFDDAFTVKDEEGNPEASGGRSAYFPLLISKTVAHVYTAAANFGYRYNTDKSKSECVEALGLGRALGANGRILGEVYSDSGETDLRVGVVELLFPKKLAKTGLEFPIYAAIGHSLAGTDPGESLTSFTFGVSIIKLPKGE